MSAVIQEQAITASQARGGTFTVLTLLAHWASAGDRTCHATIKKLAGRARLSERQVQRAIHDLQEWGEIEVVEGGEGGRSVRRYFRLLVGAPEGWNNTIPARERVTFATQKGDMGVTPIHIQKVIKGKAMRSKNQYPAWLSQYPQSDPVNEREPDAQCERWLWLEAITKFGLRSVEQGRKRFGDNFYVWRKAKIQWDEGATTLRECLEIGEQEFARERRDSAERDRIYAGVGGG